MFRVLHTHRKLQFQVHRVKGHVEWLFHPPGHGYPSISCQIKVPTRLSGVSVVTAGSANGLGQSDLAVDHADTRV